MNHEMIINARIKREELIEYVNSLFVENKAKITVVDKEYILEHNPWILELDSTKQDKIILEGMKYYKLGEFAEFIRIADSKEDKQDRRREGLEIYQRRRAHL